MNDLLFSEILELFQKAETRKEKLAVLQQNGDAVFQEFLYCAFHIASIVALFKILVFHSYHNTTQSIYQIVI